jgi:hypothetical protein
MGPISLTDVANNDPSSESDTHLIFRFQNAQDQIKPEEKTKAIIKLEKFILSERSLIIAGCKMK